MQYFRKPLLALVLTLPWAHSATAQPTATNSLKTEQTQNKPTAKQKNRLQSQRFAYQAAKSALKNKQFNTVKAQLKAMGDYPLKPYLEYQLLAFNTTPLDFTAIDAFLAAYPQSLLADRVKSSLLFTLAEHQQWQDFNRYYTAGFSSSAMQCRSLLARHHTGDAAALDEAVALWAVGQSQPEACDPLFSLLEKNKKITRQARWQRFDQAINNNKIALAKYVQRSMSKEQQVNANLYLAVQANPSLITQNAKFMAASPEIQQIIAYGISHLAQKNPQQAWAHWEKYEAQRLFDATLATQTKQRVIKQLTRNGFFDEAQQLLSYSHSLRETSTVEELLRENLEQMDWQALVTNIELLPQTDRQTDRWQYWHARSHQELKTESVDATLIYQELAKKRSWYGFLAADLVKANYKLEDASTPADPNIKAHIANNGAMRRAYELWAIGEKQQARAEWYYGLKAFSTDEILAAGELARDWGWYNSGIVAMITGNLWDHLTLRFPLAYTGEIAEASANTQLDQALIFAIARQESAFAADVVSHAGARGLMQLMPATAKEQAKASGIKNHTTNDLFTPEHNIQLGSAYLGGLLDQFKGNRILAAAAYNAGPGRVKRWLGTPMIEKPADVWVETIPFKETRQYVQNVLTYSVIYNYRMSADANINGTLVRPEEANIRL